MFVAVDTYEILASLVIEKLTELKIIDKICTANGIPEDDDGPQPPQNLPSQKRPVAKSSRRSMYLVALKAELLAYLHDDDPESDTPEGQKGTEFLSVGKLDEFWAGPTNKSRPNLRELVAVLFTIRASTAAVERFFSTTGLILVPRRNQLGNDKFKKLSILRQEMRSGGGVQGHRGRLRQGGRVQARKDHKEWCDV